MAAPDGERQVSGWHEIYQELYRDADAADFGENFAGWDSSYDGLSIPLEQMRHWRDATVESIRALKPRRILEIGVGSGLLMSRLVADCEEYWGADMSEAVIEALRTQLDGQPKELADRVRLQAAPAHQLDDLPPGHFDTVVINSVIQYFPHVDYLTEVLTKAVMLLAPGGSVFVGDVRDLELLPRFHTAVAVTRGEDTALRESVARISAREKELALSPEYFEALPELLPELEGVDLRLKAGPFHNELTRHRYDVVLRTAAPDLDLTEAPRLDWSADGLTLPALRERLAAEPGPLRVSGVPNRRLAGEDAAWRALAEGRPADAVRAALQGAPVDEDAPDAVEPDALRELAGQTGHHAAITLTGSDHTRFDAVLWPGTAHPADAAVTGVYLGRETAETGAPPAFDFADPNRYANTPAALEADTVEAPARTGAPATVPSGGTALPRTPYEDTVRALFAEVLSVPRHTVGCDDDFFLIGGHSLASARLVGRIRAVLGVALGMRSVYEARTVTALAELVRRQTPKRVPGRGMPVPPAAAGDGCADATVTEAPLAVGAAAHRTLTALAREHGATSGMLLQAAVTALLVRTTGAAAITLAVATAGPEQALPVTTPTDGRTDFLTLLGRVRTACLESWAGAVDQGAAQPSLTLAFELSRAAARGPAVELAERWSDTGAPAGIEGRVLLPADAGAEVFAARLVRLLDAVAAEPYRLLDTLDLHLPGERGTAGPARRPVPQTPLPAMLGLQALLTPQAPAVVTPDGSLTHAELEQRAGHLAGRLQALGAGPGHLVAVALPAGPDLVVAYAAVARSGAACLPLAPGRAAPRTSCRPVAVIGAAGGPPWPGIPVLPVQPADAEGLPAAQAGLPAGRAGDPVLAMGTADGLVTADGEELRTLNAWRFATMPAEAAAPRAVLPGPDTDHGFLAIADALASGATVHLPGPGEESAQARARWLAGTGAVELAGPAEAVTWILRAAAEAGLELPALKVLALDGGCSGRPPQPAGATATAVPVVLEHHWLAGVRFTTVRTGAGTAPLWNQAVRVLDAELRPVPPGLVGALHFAGSALGSLRAEHARDAERWVADPHGEPGARMLRTGRTARARAEGMPEVLAGTVGHDPFEDAGGLYLVLAGPDGHRSLWPAETAVPAGWTATGPEDVLDAAREALARVLPAPLAAPAEPSLPDPASATRSSR